MNRNNFLENLHFDEDGSVKEYNKYLNEYKEAFYKQAIDAHKAIVETFPGLDFHTICRIKSYDSSIEKIRDKSFEKVFDIHGIKHIIHSINEDSDESNLIEYCYKLKTFLEGYYLNLGTTICRTKDYIQAPKENGYKAIHISGTVSLDNSRKFETQIKTAEMEKVAKYGNANHSEKYKPRTLGNNPLSKVPRYMVIITRDNGETVFHELSLDSCFQYFYNVPYADYLDHQK